MDQLAASRLRILILESSASDVARMEEALREVSVDFQSKQVDSQDTFAEALDDYHPDIILCSYSLPGFNGMTALRLVRQTHPEIPVIMITHPLTDVEAVELIRAGAKDYVLKERLMRLPSAVQHVLDMERGIRARKETEQTMRETISKLNLFRALIDHSSDGIEVIDPATMHFLDVNETECHNLGYARDEMLAMTVADIDPLVTAELEKMIAAQMGESRNARFESMYLRKDGSMFPVEINAKLIELDKPYILSIVRDITERKQAEDALRTAHNLLHTIVENAPIRVFWKDTESQYLGCNTAFAHDAGMDSPENIIGKDDFQMGWHEQADLYRADDKRVMDDDTPKLDYEEPQTTPDGNAIWLRTSKVPLHDETGKVFGILGIYEDITNHKKTELEREQYFKFFNSSTDLMGIADPNGAFKQVNPTFLNTLGYTEAEILAKPFIEFVHPDDRQSTLDEMKRQLDQGYSLDFENRYICKNGSIRWLSWRANVNYDEGVTYATARDITDRKQAEKLQKKLTRALMLLSRSNSTLVHADSERGLLSQICHLAVESGGYLMAWVGFAENDEYKTVRPVAKAGHETGYLKRANITWADSERGRGPTGTAIRTKAIQINQNILTNPAMEPWRKLALMRGYQASIALPLIEDDRSFGALMLYSGDADSFDPEETALLAELAADLAFGISTLRTHKERDQAMLERRQYIEKLRKSLEDALQAISATVEMRDPYTAGHQKRVANIAVAIARELGLSEERIHGLRLAAIVHDIGKIHIPAEMLSKPSRLTDIEYSLIKLHPQVGFDILKEIDFPWPIAKVVLQHHERMNGSGYPLGLNGEEIILEARILSVADVVEAISSHRPYRPSLGKKAALDEIRKNKGILYDATVVDACLKLFSERKYRFPSIKN